MIHKHLDKKLQNLKLHSVSSLKLHLWIAHCLFLGIPKDQWEMCVYVYTCDACIHILVWITMIAADRLFWMQQDDPQMGKEENKAALLCFFRHL
jgi:hypothetical protein